MDVINAGQFVAEYDIIETTFSFLSLKGVLELQSQVYFATLEQSYMGEKIPNAWIELEEKIVGYVIARIN